MSRQRKYITKEEKKEAQHRWQREHYYRHREKILKKARAKYAKKYNILKNIYGE